MEGQGTDNLGLEIPTNSVAYSCTDCGRSDETVRFVIYPFVVSLLVVTFRRTFTGIWCSRHRFLRGSLACLITSIFGWFGIPWGLFFTPVALYQLARGGIKDNEANAKILSEVGQEKLAKGDRRGAIRCFEQSLYYKEQLATRDSLKLLYAYRHSNEISERSAIWKLATFFSVPFVLYLVGTLIGLFDYGIGIVFGSLFGGTGNIITAILSWIPLVLSLFGVIVLLRKILEWIVRAVEFTSVVPVVLVILFYTSVFLYAVVGGEAFGRLFQYIYYGIQFNDLREIILTVPPMITRGGIYFLSDILESGNLWTTIYLLILLACAALSLTVNIPLMTTTVKWHKALKDSGDGDEQGVNGSFLAVWAAIGTLSLSFFVLFWLVPQQTHVDFLTASEHYFIGMSHIEAGEFEQAALEFEQAHKLRPGDVNIRLGWGYAYYYNEDYPTASRIFADGLEVDPQSLYLLEAAGWASYQLREVESAKINFEAALEVYPDSPGAHLGLGWIYLFEDTRLAIDEFNFVLTQAPEQANAHLGMGIAYYLLRDYDLAIDELYLAIKDEYMKPPAYLALGNLYLAERDYDLALEAFAEALALMPDFYDAQLGMAQVYMELDEYEEALEQIESAIKAQPENPVGYIYMSGIRSWQGEYTQSLNEIEKALTLDSENIMAHAVKSSILYQIGQNKAAEAELQRADEIEAVDYQSAYLVAVTFGNMQQYEEAITHLEAAVPLLPGGSDPDYFSTLARYYSALGKFEQAQQAISDAIKIDSGDPATYVTLGRLFIDQEELITARQYFEKALEFDPEDDGAHAGLSFVYLQQGNSGMAVQEAQLAVEQAKYSRGGYESLALSYHAHGQLEDAFIAAKEAVRLDPTSSLSHYILGVCYMDKGMNEEALREFEKFLDYYFERAYIRDYKLKAEEYISALRPQE